MMIDNFNLNNSEKNSLLSYARNNSFPQTMLIEGRDSETRLQFAQLVANMILCNGTSTKPCGECNACVKCSSGNHPDIKVFGESDGDTTFKIELSREIKADAFVIPNDGDKKVFILLETQNMNDASANALLKILEEPPEFDYFILTCNSKSAMLDTILSRAALINIGQSEKVLSDEVVTMAKNIVTALVKDSEIYLVEALAPLAGDKKSFKDTMACLTEIFTDSLVYKQTESNNSDYADVTEELCARLTAPRIFELIKTVEKLNGMFEMNANYNILTTFMSGALRQAAGK